MIGGYASSVLTKARSTVLYERLARYPDLHRFVKFAMVGTLNLGVHLGLYNVLLWAGWPTLAANAVAFLVASVNSFVWNKVWAFRDPRRERIVRQYLVFVSFTIIGLGINTGVLALLLIPFAEHGALGKNLALLGALPFSVGWNFLAYRRWTFKPGPGISGT